MVLFPSIPKENACVFGISEHQENSQKGFCDFCKLGISLFETVKTFLIEIFGVVPHNSSNLVNTNP